MTIMFQKFETYMTITPLLLFESGWGVKTRYMIRRLS